MLLTLSTSHTPATDLGHLLHKHPDRVQSFSLAFGQAHVFYPEVSAERCTAALLLDIDPIALVRGRGPGAEAGLLDQYVNDRPYVASSLLSVAIAKVFGSALAGRSQKRPELAEAPLPLEATIAVLPCTGGEEFLHRLFGPLGYAVHAQGVVLDEHFPEWGASHYYHVELRGITRLRDLLAHLTVLIPVLDDQKHYWVGTDEVDKLLRRGAGWLAHHPERDLITRRYLRHRHSLVQEALVRLVEDATVLGENEDSPSAIPEAGEEGLALHQQRLGAVLAVLKASGARRVLDLGCGEGRLLQLLLAEPAFEEIVGLDVSHRALERARERLHLDRLRPRQRERIRLIHGALTYRDRRIEGFDAAAVVEVIEHLDPVRLAWFEQVVFGHARPRTLVLTTPNAEYNPRFPGLPPDGRRHPDHRFEWTRAQFRAWAERVAAQFGYSVRLLPVGPPDPELGPPTQMGVFTR